MEYLVANYPRLVSGLVHPSFFCGWSRSLSHVNHWGYNPLTSRGMSHQVRKRCCSWFNHWNWFEIIYARRVFANCRVGMALLSKLWSMDPTKQTWSGEKQSLMFTTSVPIASAHRPCMSLSTLMWAIFSFFSVQEAWIWVNYNISLTWIVGPFGDDFPEINHDFQGSVAVRSL